MSVIFDRLLPEKVNSASPKDGEFKINPLPLLSEEFFMVNSIVPSAVIVPQFNSLVKEEAEKLIVFDRYSMLKDDSVVFPGSEICVNNNPGAELPVVGTSMEAMI